jgi:hypothetical protein
VQVDPAIHVPKAVRGAQDRVGLLRKNVAERNLDVYRIRKCRSPRFDNICIDISKMNFEHVLRLVKV